MTKMDMIWIGVASLIYPQTSSNTFVRKANVEKIVSEMFGATITPVMLTKHLVNSEDRQADKDNPDRGGSRDRYLFKNSNGEFRLSKDQDSTSDGWDKKGPTHPDPSKLDEKFIELLEWYKNEYANS